MFQCSLSQCSLQVNRLHVPTLFTQIPLRSKAEIAQFSPSLQKKNTCKDDDKHTVYILSILLFRYPRYITEQKCLVSDRGCFQGEGLCTDTFVTQIILKKTQNCVLSKNGIYLEEWKPTYYRIRVGCACELRRNTFLTAFI